MGRSRIQANGLLMVFGLNQQQFQVLEPA